MPEGSIHHQLQVLTDRLYRLVDEKQGNLADPGVVAVSQEMDQLIVFIQRNRLFARKS